MSKLNSTAKRIGGFLRRNATYFLIVLCIASIATVIALAVTGNFSETTVPAEITGEDEPVIKPEDPVIKPEDPVIEPLTFACPVNGTSTNDYSADEMVWNETLKESSTHTGVDFVSEDLKVCAVAAGTVTEVVKNDLLDGTYVIVSHAEGYESRYYSLADNVSVQKGDSVIEGQLIGMMSDSMATEALDGNHLHFEMSKNSVDINPLEVIILEEK